MQMIALVFVVMALSLVLGGCSLGGGGEAGTGHERDAFPTSAGELGITFIGHGTLMLDWQGKTIHVDPYGAKADYTKLPDADLLLITHEHFDHMDPSAIEAIRTDKTRIVLTETCAKTLQGGIAMGNGDVKEVMGLTIRAVPAYNVRHTRSGGQPFHPKGVGNGYVLTFADKKVYIAGDTEDIPEMAELKDIDVAFLPMNLPYTMTPEMTAAAARSFMPKVLYPYHFGETDCSKLVELLKDTPDVEVRLRQLQ